MILLRRLVVKFNSTKNRVFKQKCENKTKTINFFAPAQTKVSLAPGNCFKSAIDIQNLLESVQPIVMV